ncbi:MAG: histidine kinase [Gemmatimonadota bacterium]|nr:histidine kinase [Gemmatimonadota bacterium]MDQ8178759.1 histidine kinase [Gemmatimonadota bacterium]
MPSTSLAAPLLQGIVTAGLALLLTHLHRRHGKSHFQWWAIALAMRVLSVLAIVTFLLTEWTGFLYLHQVFLGWTACGLLYAAQVFARQQVWDRRFWFVAAFPVLWSVVAIFVLDHFALAAGVAVLFLALATLWAGVVFLRYRRRTGSPAAGFLATVMFLWALHHLDYPLLRARGAWDPWGYYLDILFTLAMGAGVLLLVIEEQREGLRTLTALSGDLRATAVPPTDADLRDALLARPLGLRGVRGAMLVRVREGVVDVVRGVGDAARWDPQTIPARVRALTLAAAQSGRSRLEGTTTYEADAPPFIAILPLLTPGDECSVLVIVGDIAAPFAALDDGILRVVGEQVGHALERDALTRRLAQRTSDLERLSIRMLQEHETQRQRIGRELHDETAQVFSALKLQLGLLREQADAGLAAPIDRLLSWVDRGNTSIRQVTEGLRPAVLDDLGLVPALRALLTDLREWSGLTVHADVEAWRTPHKGVLTPEAEVALFRALQEALSNVVRHAGATTVRVTLTSQAGLAHLEIVDDGAGVDATLLERLASAPGRSGLFGMRERIRSVGGRLTLALADPGLCVRIEIPETVV